MKKPTTIILLLAIMLAAFFHGRTQTTDWCPMAPMDAALAQSTAAVLDGKVYIIGGIPSPDSEAVSDVRVYDIESDSWLNNAPDLPEPLCAASASVLNGKIYVTGGHKYYNPSGARASVYEFDLSGGGTWTKKSDMLKPRFYHASAVLDGKIYVMGGRSQDIESSVEVYDPDTDTWTFIDGMNSARALHTAVTANGMIFVMGSSVTTDTSMEVFNPYINEWVVYDHMPGGRLWHGSCVIDNSILVFGGAPARETWEYDLGAHRWTVLENSALPESIGWFGFVAADFEGEKRMYTFGGAYDDFFLGGPGPYTANAVYRYCHGECYPLELWTYQDTMPAARRYCTGAVLDNKIYVIGGQFFISPADTSYMISYDPVTRNFDTTLSDPPKKLRGGSACVFNGKIYLFGGWDMQIGSSTKLVYEYDPDTDTWTQKTDMPTSRLSVTTVLVDGKIYAISKEAVEVYDPVADHWTTAASMQTNRAGFSAVSIGGKIYVMGGASGYFIKNTVEVYDPKKNEWTYGDSMPVARSLHGSAVINDQIYVFGGWDFDFIDCVTTWSYSPSSGTWTDLGVTMPFTVIGFASGVVQDADGNTCLYTLGGMNTATIPTAAVFKYCPISVGIEKIGNPKELSSLQVYPNPFQASTFIQYRLQHSGRIIVKVFNLAGQEVKTLFDGNQPAGLYEIQWHADGLPSGVYIFRLQADRSVQISKAILQDFE